MREVRLTVQGDEMREMPDGPMKEFAEGFRSFAFSLEREIRQRFASLMGEQNLTRVELEIALRSLYWDYPGGIDNTDWLLIAFVVANDSIFSRAEYDLIIQNFRYPFPCAQCNSDIPILVRDRQDADRFWGEITLLCQACTRERGSQREEEYRRRDTEEKLMVHEAAIAELRAMSYADYLLTHHWQTVRQATLKRDHNRCQLCRSTERLQVHHNTYERLGCEDPDDTVTLCGDCHQMFHDHRQLARPQ